MSGISTPGNNRVARLRERMERLGISENDIKEKFVQGSGPGGQKINKTASCVVLSYKLENIDIKCQRTRSLTLNRYYARYELCERITEQLQEEKSKRQQEAERIRRQKRRRSRKQRARMLEEKRQHSEKKAFRTKPDMD